MRARPILQYVLIFALLFAMMGRIPAMAQEATPSPGDAGSETQFSAHPEGGADGERFEAEIKPGDTAKLTLVMANAGAIPLALHSFTADVHTAVNGGLTMDQEGSAQTAPTTWMAFEPATADLAPGAEISRAFTVTVPAGTAPGQYVNAVAVQTVDDYEIPGSKNFRQRVRKVLAVYITVPGELKGAFTLGTPAVENRTRGPVLQVPIENTGNVRLRPHGDLVVKDSSGAELLKAPVEMGSVFAGHSTLIEVRMKDLVPPGNYTISLNLVDDESGAKGSLADSPLVMPDLKDQVSSPVTIESATVKSNADPIQFAEVTVEVGNAGEVVPGSTLTLSVSKDGAFVEDMVLADSLALNAGITKVQQRYIPASGFETGTYTFSLKLESVNPNTGVRTLLLDQKDVATLKVP